MPSGQSCDSRYPAATIPLPAKPEDPGALKIFGFEDGQLTNRASIAPGGGYGFGPRHLDFHPAQPWVYVSLERQNKLESQAAERQPRSASQSSARILGRTGQYPAPPARWNGSCAPDDDMSMWPIGPTP